MELFIIHIYIYTLKTVIFLLYLGTVHVNSSKSKISFVPNQSQVHKLQQAIEKKMSIGYKIGAVHITDV